VIRHVIMDMDGVVYRGEDPVPGAIETLEALRHQGVNVAFLTNNASRHRVDLVAKLRDMGLPCSVEQMWGSAYTTARYLASEAPDAKIYVIGMAGMIREFEEAGLTVIADYEQASHVVVGLDRDFTYEKLTRAHRAICRGATFIATNLDVTFPDSPLTTVPGAGALAAALQASTGVAPQVIGKPQPTAMALIAGAWSVGPESIVAVGDRLDTDIAAAKTFGCMAVLVLTGIASRADATKATGLQKPDVILQDLTELIPLLSR
jgi:phosphoglycolate/pyridoxal phosphate phosphatase family enzyme